MRKKASPANSFPAKNAVFYACAALISVILIAFLLQMLHKTLAPANKDFTTYLYAATDLLAGINPYARATNFPYVYPMFFAVLMIPLTFLPLWLSAVIWFLVLVSSLYLLIKLFVNLLPKGMGGKWGRQLILPVFLTLLLFTNPLQGNFLWLQVNILVLFFCVLFLHFYTAKKPFIASLVLAVAVSIKIVPAIFLLFLAFRREFKLIALCLLFTAVFCIGLPYLFLGEGVFPAYRSYTDNFILRAPDLAFASREHAFFSLNGFMYYIFPSFSTLPFVKYLTLFFIAAPLALIDALNYRKAWAFPVIFSLYLTAVPLIVTDSQVPHLILILPAVLLIVLRLFFIKGWRTGVNVAVSTCIVLCFILARIFGYSPFWFISLVLISFLLVRMLSSSPKIPSRRS